MVLLQLLFWSLLFYAALRGLAFLWGRLLAVEHQRTAMVFADTDDGWRLALSRHRPAELRSPTPVLLVPPLGFSAAIFEQGEHPWARAFVAAGRDTWLLDPRGRGFSSRPRLGGRRRSWSLDDYIELDLPAALRTLRATTGAKQVDIVAFGGGALCAYPVVARDGGEGVRALVSIAGAAHFTRQQERISPRALSLLRWISPVFLLRLFAPLVGRLELPWLRDFTVLDNVEATTYRRALLNAVAEPAPRELAQWRSWLEGNRYRAQDDGPDYREALGAISSPLLFICGPRDPFSPPSMAKETLEACIQARTRALLVASRQEGLAANYGHLDMLLGRSVARDLQPRVQTWLEALDEEERELDVEEQL